MYARQRHRLARKSDHPLDEIRHGWAGTELRRRSAKDDDVARVDAVQVVGQLVDHDAITDLQSRFHGARRDGIGGDHEGAEQDRHHDRGHQDPDELENPTRGRRLLPARRLGGCGRLVAGRRGLLGGHDQEYDAWTRRGGGTPDAGLSRPGDTMSAWFGPSSSTSTARSPAGRTARPATPASSPIMATPRTQPFSTAISRCTTASN